MMKKILIFAYIMAVLALSGMVKADQPLKGRGLVDSAEISTAGILDIEYRFTTPCQERARVAINKIDEPSASVYLVVQTTIRKGLCSDVLTPDKKLVFDMKSLPLRVGNTYNVVFNNFSGPRNSLSYKAVTGGFNEQDYNSEQQDFKGVLIPTEGTEQLPAGVALRNNLNEVVPVISPDMLPQLSSLINGEVHLTGYTISAAALYGSESPTQSSQGQNFAQVIVPVSVSQ
jgi:hypothetical protein